MVSAGLIAFREGLEAALLVGIVLSYLQKTGQQGRSKYIWLGVFGAVVASIGLAIVIQFIGVKLEGRAEEIFEAMTMFLAVGVLTWMIFWMQYQARLIRSSLESKVQSAIETGRNRGLTLLAFVAVFREGVEMVLFLSAAAFAVEGGATLTGALIGLALAGLIGYLTYQTTSRLDIQLFFRITSVVLLLFAAGLLAHGIHELQEAGILGTLYEPIWDTNHILDEKSTLGEFFKALFGYNGNPSLEEAIAYGAYWLMALLGIRWLVDRKIERMTVVQEA